MSSQIWFSASVSDDVRAVEVLVTLYTVINSKALLPPLLRADASHAADW